MDSSKWGYSIKGRANPQVYGERRFQVLVYRPYSRSREQPGGWRSQKVHRQEEQGTDALLDVNEYEKRRILLAESLGINLCKVVRKLCRGRNKNLIEIKQSKNCIREKVTVAHTAK